MTTSITSENVLNYKRYTDNRKKDEKKETKNYRWTNRQNELYR